MFSTRLLADCCHSGVLSSLPFAYIPVVVFNMPPSGEGLDVTLQATSLVFLRCAVILVRRRPSYLRAGCLSLALLAVCEPSCIGRARAGVDGLLGIRRVLLDESATRSAHRLPETCSLKALSGRREIGCVVRSAWLDGCESGSVGLVTM